MEKNGFLISKMKTIVCQKTAQALADDKGQYFGVKLETLRKIEGVTELAKE
jgi:hypothetical protein